MWDKLRSWFSPPIPPQGVVMVRGDTGERIRCEVLYLGRDKGVAQWQVTGVIMRVGLDQLEVKYLPAHTGIGVQTDQEVSYD